MFRYSMTYVFLEVLKSRTVLLIALCFGCVWILLQIDVQKESFILFNPPRFCKDNSSQLGFLVDTFGCRIPDLNPFDQSIKQFIFTEKPIVCDLENVHSKKGNPPLILSNLSSLYVNEAAFASYGIYDENDFTCCYKPFWRVEVKKPVHALNINDDAKIRFGNSCIPFVKEVSIDEEFVKVVCRYNSTTIYKDYHAFVPLKKDVEDRCNKIQTKDAVSVLVIGIDAVSRLNLYRQMPGTLSFIRKNMNFVEMLGYNKVDDNTFLNLVPVLAGLSVDELKKVCWPNLRAAFDDCPLLWKNYSSLGYRTMFAEDASWMGTFNYDKVGFKKQPTDYSTRIFNKISEDEIGREKRLNANLCIGARLSADVLLNYASKFVITMLNKLSFAFVWGASLSHDYLNLPKFGDKYYENFFRNLLNLGVFNNTVLIFMSDHGIRWGGIRETYQGYLEERLPFLFIAYPAWFTKKYATAVINLKRNSHRLTTPFDLHKTLMDLLNLDTLEESDIKRRSSDLYSSKTLPRGISLFLPVHENRTCEKAKIAEHWCTCHQAVRVSVNDSFVKQSVDFLIKHINNLLIPFPQCSKLQLFKIINARIEKSTAKRTTDTGIRDYTLTVQTTPGNALFEATVRYNANNVPFSLAGAISRINLYGRQSYCVSHYRMKLYCYC